MAVALARQKYKSFSWDDIYMKIPLNDSREREPAMQAKDQSHPNFKVLKGSTTVQYSKQKRQI